jgi:hypothetical protein
MGVKISALPSVAVPALTDVFPIVQNGVTYKETVTQLSTLIGTVSVTTITGTPNQVIASSPTGAITLSLPQSIATTSDVTFGSVTFSPTTKGIVGTTTNNNAAAGYVGEIIESTVLVGSAVPLTNHTNADITSISLTAGDWQVWGNIWNNPAGGTLTTAFAGWINTTSATSPTAPNGGAFSYSAANTAAGQAQGVSIGQKRLSLSSPTTVYLSVIADFSVSTLSAYGYIGARRIR